VPIQVLLVRPAPLETLCSRSGILDVALKRHVARSEILDTRARLLSHKGGWKIDRQRTLLYVSPPGMDDQVLIAAGQRDWYQDRKKEELLGPLPPPPDFPDPIEAVRERIVKVIGKLTTPREVRVWHPAIEDLSGDAGEVLSSTGVRYWTILGSASRSGQVSGSAGLSGGNGCSMSRTGHPSYPRALLCSQAS
jgi:hypothetical protein